MSNINLSGNPFQLGQHRNKVEPGSKVQTQPVKDVPEQTKTQSPPRNREIFMGLQRLTTGTTQIGQQQIDDIDQGIDKTPPSQLQDRSEQVPKPGQLQRALSQTLPIQQPDQTQPLSPKPPLTSFKLQDIDLNSDNIRLARQDMDRAMRGLSTSSKDMLKGHLRDELKSKLKELSKLDGQVLITKSGKKDELSAYNTKVRNHFANLINQKYAGSDELSILLKATPRDQLKEVIAELVGELRDGKPVNFAQLSDKKKHFVNKVCDGLGYGITGIDITNLKLKPQAPGMKQGETQLGRVATNLCQSLELELNKLSPAHVTQLKAMDEKDLRAHLEAKFGKSGLTIDLLMQTVRDYQLNVPPRGVEPFVRDLTHQDLLGQGVSESLQALSKSPGNQKARDDLSQAMSTHLQSLGEDHNSKWKLGLMTAPELKALLKPVAELNDKDAEWLMQDIRSKLPNRTGPVMQTVSGNGKNYEVPGEIILGDKVYKPKAFLAEAGFGVVFKYTNEKDENDHVAVKLLMEKEAEGVNAKVVHQESVKELDLHRELQGSQGHGNIIGLKGALHAPNGTLCMVQEFATGGTLFDLAGQMEEVKDKLSPEARQLLGLALLKQSLEGVKYLHDDREMIHSDLKSPNLMLSGDGVKMIDFGTASTGQARNIDKTIVDNPIYCAPEQFVMGNKQISTKSDIWSIGTLGYELLVGPIDKHPTFGFQFTSEIGEATAKHLGNVDSRIMSNSPEGVPSESRKPVHDLIDKMMMPLPEQRLGAKELLQLPILQDPRLDSPQMKQIIARLAEPLPSGKTDSEKAQIRFDRVLQDLQQLSQPQ